MLTYFFLTTSTDSAHQLHDFKTGSKFRQRDAPTRRGIAAAGGVKALSDALEKILGLGTVNPENKKFAVACLRAIMAIG